MITVLAANDFGDNLGDGVAGPLGLLIIVLLVVALVFLIRSMNKHLRRVRDDFPDDETVARMRADALSERSRGRAPRAATPAPRVTGAVPSDTRVQGDVAVDPSGNTDTGGGPGAGTR
ncbi:MAG TPA: hypothetical protein VE132_07490 [Micromonosporaceae bacterium]|nr:hypothetical protein [Micromonosporaceae bacterium]